MLPVLAEESVEKKLEREISVLVSNYEFYYAAGKLAALTALEAERDTPPQQLKEAVDRTLAGFVPKEGDKKTAYLLYLLEKYRPREEYAPEMAELFDRGRKKQ